MVYSKTWFARAKLTIPLAACQFLFIIISDICHLRCFCKKNHVSLASLSFISKPMHVHHVRCRSLIWALNNFISKGLARCPRCPADSRWPPRGGSRPRCAKAHAGFGGGRGGGWEVGRGPGDGGGIEWGIPQNHPIHGNLWQMLMGNQWFWCKQP